MIRIFAEGLAAGERIIRGDEHHYLARVRRAAAGDALELLDGAGLRAHGTIEAIGTDETRVTVGAIETIRELPPRIRALVPVIKGDRMDVCIEKLVEVGADELVVWPAARAVVRLDGERRDARLEHYRAIAQAAARQCGRATTPSIAGVDSLASAITALPAGVKIVLDPGADRAAPPIADHVTIISGPEGGFAPHELDALTIAGFLSIGLGPRTLRADTAPVIAVALLRSATAS